MFGKLKLLLLESLRVITLDDRNIVHTHRVIS